MLLDAETLLPAPEVAAVLAAADGRPLPGQLKTELHASIVELNTDVCADAPEALEAVRALRAAADEAARASGVRIAAAGAHPTAAARVARGRPGAALPRDARVRRPHGAAPGRERAPRPRRDARRRRVHAGARVRPPVAAGRARALGELAVPRRRGHGLLVEPRPDPRRAAAFRRAARVRVLRGVGGLRRAADGARAPARLHRVLVGRAPASALRDARAADARPADRGRAHRRVRRAPPGPLRRRARVSGTRRRRRRPRPLRAEPLGGRTLRAAGDARRAGSRPAGDGRGARRRAARARPARGGGARLGVAARRRSTPSGARPTSSARRASRAPRLRSPSGRYDRRRWRPGARSSR